jgi:predicted alpha/beta-fold hydrolase
MRMVLRLSIWLLSVYLLLCTGIAIFLADVTIHPYHRPLPANAGIDLRREVVSNSQFEDVDIPAQDHAQLHAWFIQPQRANGQAVILLHGLGDNRLGTLGYAQILLTHGYAVLMPDARAHGESGGNLATYGLLERDDIRRWFEWIQAKHPPRCIFGLGESMGAAQLLQSLAAEPNFCAVVAESPFATFREIAYDRMGQHFHSGPWLGRTVLRPVVEIALLIVRFRYDVDLEQASPAEIVAGTKVPVLLIHGQLDSNIPLRHSHLIQARNSRVELWQVPGADHCGAISVAPQELERRTIAWFAVH